MKLGAITLILLIILTSSVYAFEPTECSNAGYVIRTDCDPAHGDIVMNLSIVPIIDIDLYPVIAMDQGDFEGRGIAGKSSVSSNTKILSNPQTEDLYVVGDRVCCNVNYAPEITSEPQTNALFADFYEYQVEATDANDHTLTYQLLQAPTSMSIGEETGLISWTVDQVESVLIEVEVSDGYYADTQSFNIDIAGTECETEGFSCETSCNEANGDEIQSYLCTGSDTCCDVNIAPIITSSPITTAAYGANYSYDVEAEDANNDVLSYLLHSAPASMAIDSVTGLITWVVDELFQVDVEVEASDNYYSDTQNFTIDISGTDCEYYGYDCTQNCDAQSGDLSLPEFSCFDSNECCDINGMPEISSSPITTANYLDNYTYQVIGSDDQPLSYALLEQPTGMIIDNETGLIQWFVTEAGTVDVAVEVSDGYYSVNQNYSITVSGSECENQGYVCSNTMSEEAGDIPQNYDCGSTATCWEAYQAPIIDFPDSFWQLKIYQTEWYGVNWTTRDAYNSQCSQSGSFVYEDCPILYPESQFQEQIVYNHTVEGDMNYWLLNWDGDEQDYNYQTGGGDYLIPGNHEIETAHVLWDDDSELQCIVQDYLENETFYNASNGSYYNITFRRLYIISYPWFTWEDGQAECEIAVDDGITNTTFTMVFNETPRGQFVPIGSDKYDPVGHMKYNNGTRYEDRTETVNGNEFNVSYSPFWNQTAGLLPYDYTVVNGNWTLGVNVSGRYTDKVIWRYVWFNYYSEQGGIPPEIPTAGWNRKIYYDDDNWEWGNCTQELIDDDIGSTVWENCNYFHFVWMDTTYNFSMEENKIFEGEYDSTLSQWNDRDVMWRYYAHAYDRDIHWSDRHFVWNIIFDNFAPGAPQNFSAHTYPSGQQFGNYPGRVGVDWAAPGDNGDFDDISFANYDLTYDENRNWGYYCHYLREDDDVLNITVPRNNISGCGWYELKYRHEDYGPITDDNWEDENTILWEPSLDWEPLPNGTYDHNSFDYIDIYPQVVPSFWKTEWIDLPEPREYYYVAMRAYDGEGNAGEIASDYVQAGYEIDMDVGFDTLTGKNPYYNPDEWDYYNFSSFLYPFDASLDCNRDRDADEWEDCQTYKYDYGWDWPNWIQRTMYLGDDLTINTTLCNYGNQNFSDYVYLMSYGQGGYREEDKMWVDLPYNESWYDYNLSQYERNADDSDVYPKTCKDIVFNHTIDRESFYMFYIVEIRRDNNNISQHPGDINSYDDEVSLDYNEGYNFHTWAWDTIAKGSYNCGGTACYTDPYYLLYNQLEPYNKQGDYHLIFNIEANYDTDFPMFDFPVHYEIIGINGSNASGSMIYNEAENGNGWNYYDVWSFHNQSDEIGFRNNFTEYMNIGGFIWQNVSDPLVYDNPLENEWIWNSTLGWYQWLGHNNDSGDYEFTFEPIYPGSQTRWWHIGNPGNYTINITVGNPGYDYEMVTRWSVDDYQVPAEEWSNRKVFEVKESENLYPTDTGVQCFVDLNSDQNYLGWDYNYTYSAFGNNYSIIVPAQGSNLEATRNDDFLYTEIFNGQLDIERFDLYHQYHFISNNDYIYNWWNWVQNWTACDEMTRPINTNDIIYISYDIVNPNPAEGQNPYGMSQLGSSKLYSYVNGNRALEDTDYFNNYIGWNNGTHDGTLNAHFYFRPKRAGTHSFEAAIDHWDNQFDEFVNLSISIDVVDYESKADFVQFNKKADKVKKPKSLETYTLPKTDTIVRKIENSIKPGSDQTKYFPELEVADQTLGPLTKEQLQAQEERNAAFKEEMKNALLALEEHEKQMKQEFEEQLNAQVSEKEESTQTIENGPVEAPASEQERGANNPFFNQVIAGGVVEQAEVPEQEE